MTDIMERVCAANAAREIACDLADAATCKDWRPSEQSRRLVYQIAHAYGMVVASRSAVEDNPLGPCVPGPSIAEVETMRTRIRELEAQVVDLVTRYVAQSKEV